VDTPKLSTYLESNAIFYALLKFFFYHEPYSKHAVFRKCETIHAQISPLFLTSKGTKKWSPVFTIPHIPCKFRQDLSRKVAMATNGLISDPDSDLDLDSDPHCLKKIHLNCRSSKYRKKDNFVKSVHFYNFVFVNWKQNLTWIWI
jgi:hypothetical protein